MADYVFNISKGVGGARIKDVVDAVDADGKIRMLLLTATPAQATGEDYDTVSAFLGDAGATEATFTGYARKDLATGLGYTVDDTTNNRFEADTADQSYTPSSSQTLVGAVIYWDPDGTDTDANSIPISHHDISITTDANFDVQIADFYRAA